MTSIERINGKQPAGKVENNEQKVSNSNKQNKNDPGIGKLLLNRAAAVVMLPVTATAGTIYLVGKSVEGLVTNKPYDKAMQEGIEAAGQGAEMIDKMWNGKYF